MQLNRAILILHLIFIQKKIEQRNEKKGSIERERFNHHVAHLCTDGTTKSNAVFPWAYAQFKVKYKEKFNIEKKNNNNNKNAIKHQTKTTETRVFFIGVVFYT